MMSSRNLCLTLVTILLCSGYVSCKWCTRLKAEKLVQTLIEFAECKQSYHAACGWFTSTQCTFYEIVPCPKEQNKTVLQYKIVEECCPGYELDPINNITCILKPVNRNYDGVHFYVSNEDLILGLSHGAFAGIICSFLFVACIIILITMHVLKRIEMTKIWE